MICLRSLKDIGAWVEKLSEKYLEVRVAEVDDVNHEAVGRRQRCGWFGGNIKATRRPRKRRRSDAREGEKKKPEAEENRDGKERKSSERRRVVMQRWRAFLGL